MMLFNIIFSCISLSRHRKISNPNIILIITCAFQNSDFWIYVL